MAYEDIEAKEAKQARAKALEARAEAERVEHEFEPRPADEGREPDPGVDPPSESPTTFSDCTALYQQATAEFIAAIALIQARGRGSTRRVRAWPGPA